MHALWPRVCAAFLALLAVGSTLADDPLPTFAELHRGKPNDPYARGDWWANLNFFNYLMASHKSPVVKYEFRDQAGKVTKVEHHHQLVVTWFVKHYALRYTVDENGKCHDVRETGNASQASRDRALTPDEQARLTALLAKLPASAIDSPPIDRAVHLSFLVGKDWQSRTYHSDALPPEFKQVIEILGERFETKRERK